MIDRPTERLTELQPREHTIYISQGRSVLASARNGFLDGSPEHGLFVLQTRMLSKYGCLIEGKQPQLSCASKIHQHSWLGYYIVSPPEKEKIGGDESDPAQQTIEVRLSRSIAQALHEDVDLINYTQQAASVRLELEIDADFADLSELQDKRQQHGKLRREWRQSGKDTWELDFDYRVEHSYNHQGNKGTARLRRGLTVRFENFSSSPEYKGGRVRFKVDLGAGGSWHGCVRCISHTELHPMAITHPCYSFFGGHSEWDEKREHFLAEATEFSSREDSGLAHVVVHTLEQAKRDLASLRMYDFDHGEDGWLPAAGLPIYVALFGRDTLTAAWEAAILTPQIMAGTLPELARWQGKETNDWRDEQPGRMLHEAHNSPLAVLNFNPRARYYGAVTTSAFYPVVVAALWHWSADKDRVAPLIEPALKALKWMDEYGDLDGDGFYEFKTHSEQGNENQGWKDSGDAIVYDDGAQVEKPVAACEEQAYAYVAKLHLSEVLWWLDRKDEAKRLFHEAEELKKRFNEAFWMEKEGFFAMGLDPEKRQIRSIGSDPGHCLASGIVDGDLVQPTMRRLLADDMFSGWGIRTLSSQHPAFNPYSYHRGSVWPVENGTFALAFARYGLHENVNLICRAQFEAAGLFTHYRLPELFAGHQRDSLHPFPALYPRANWPQAWSASAVFTMLQSMLGLYIPTPRCTR